MAEIRLTKEIAERFLADEDSVDLWEFTELEDAAAESLSKHKGDLGLNSLTALSDAAAERFRKHVGGLRLLRRLRRLAIGKKLVRLFLVLFIIWSVRQLVWGPFGFGF